MSSTFPDDIIPEILCRLPVKDLLRFRSVSKPWRSLIDGSDFIKLHLTRSHNNRGAIVTNHELFWINLDSPASAAKIPNPIDDTELIGSCNGLVALRNSLSHVALWNPATRRHRSVPIPSSEFPCLFFSEIIGFGHDPVKDDYKLLRMVVKPPLETDDFDSVFTVYSLRKKSWKRVEGPTPRTFGECFRKQHALVRNAFHWIVEGSQSMVIFAFDVGPERFHEVPSPTLGGTCGAEVFLMKIVELRGCLCLACHYSMRSGAVVCVKAWMMKEYGARESWTTLLCVGPTEMGGPFTYVAPVAFVGDRVLLEKDNSELALYDLRSQSAEIVKISGVESYDAVKACVESLVRLDLGGGDGDDSNKEKPIQKRRKRDDFLSKGFQLRL